MSDLKECYECGAKVHQLSSRSRCVNCENRRALFNENDNEELRNRIAELERELEIAEKHLHDEHFEWYVDEIEQLRKGVNDESQN